MNDKWDFWIDRGGTFTDVGGGNGEVGKTEVRRKAGEAVILATPPRTQQERSLIG